jgi:hypothetical protein
MTLGIRDWNEMPGTCGCDVLRETAASSELLGCIRRRLTIDTFIVERQRSGQLTARGRLDELDEDAVGIDREHESSGNQGRQRNGSSGISPARRPTAASGRARRRYFC